MLTIKAPIWRNKSVGIAIRDLPDDHVIDLEITACRKKDGYRYYPNPFKITVGEVKAKKIMIEERKGNKPMLYIVPIIDLHEVKPQENQTESSNGPESAN